jgi:hypothetical protein
MSKKISDKDCERIADGIVNNIYQKKWYRIERRIKWKLLFQLTFTIVIISLCVWLFMLYN